MGREIRLVATEYTIVLLGEGPGGLPVLEALIPFRYRQTPNRPNRGKRLTDR